MANVRTYTPQEQERLIRSTMPRSAYRVTCLMGRNQAEIMNLAIHRGITLGYEQYGDESFFHSQPRLRHESICELADCVWYQSIYDLKERKVIT